MNLMHRITIIALACIGGASAAEAPPPELAGPPELTAAPRGPLAGLRGPAPLNEEPKAPRMANIENTDMKRSRAYTSQPPTIPHAIEKYEITRNVNFCMYCHSRVRHEQFGAPMVSATHYMDRDQNFLAEISPGRYFCTQCHVVQTDVKPPVENGFVDVYDIVAREQAEAKSEGEKPRR